MNSVTLTDIQIRTTLLPGDLGYVAHLHGKLYEEECKYGLNFEKYVMKGLYEFIDTYNPDNERVWICEHNEKIIGFLLGCKKEESLQLRYFIILPEYRGIGLASKLMEHFVFFMRAKGYSHSYLWTTEEQKAAIHLYKKFNFQLTQEKVSKDTFSKEITEQRFDLHL
ncbi:GNAT family N-acetyltransferase [Fulvivirga ligni]|uniref:GNAT family N-acetyltransferase n=1 Tax=Fulvivirga ligni TaxID=2904246 RepID=UPI001F302540|nr:GNAT family N-acetyltransferase [Fulvivirga ligni]UII21349.1 GNAT family N-acetyltransferase [Fulvivirga ligni]